MNPDTGEWQSFKSPSKDESTAMCFSYSGGKTLYAGMLSGLCKINIETSQRTILFGNQQGRSFLKKDIQSMYRDSRNLLWLCHSKGVTIWNEVTDSIYYLD